MSQLKSPPETQPSETSSPFGRRMLYWTIAAVLAVPVSYFLMLGVVAWSRGYSWKEMDWERRGYTTISDFLRATDIGKRPVLVGGKTCTEYYALREGLSVRTDCPD